MCKVTSAWSLQKAASFGGNELLLHKHIYTHTYARMCVCVCLYAVYTKIAKLKVRQAFLIGAPKSMLRFSAFFCCERTRAAWREAKRNVYAAWCARCEIYDGSISRGAFHVIVFWVHVSHFDFSASFFCNSAKAKHMPQ